MLLSEFLSSIYSAEKDLSAGYLIDLKNTLNIFGYYLGEPPKINDCNRDTVNQFLAYLGEMGRRPCTVKKNRANLLALWNYAYEIEMTDTPPKRIKRPRIVCQPPEAWTRDEIVLLVETADRQRGLIFGRPSRWYWKTLVVALYETGLRIGDLLSIRRSQVGLDGRFTVNIQKTRSVEVKQISAWTLSEIDREKIRGKEPIWPESCRRSFHRAFGKLVRDSGIRPGTTRWLRRSSASYVESVTPGAGADHLGHSSPSVTRRHYLDPHIVIHAPRLPPPLVAG